MARSRSIVGTAPVALPNDVVAAFNDLSDPFAVALRKDEQVRKSDRAAG